MAKGKSKGNGKDVNTIVLDFLTMAIPKIAQAENKAKDAKFHSKGVNLVYSGLGDYLDHEFNLDKTTRREVLNQLAIAGKIAIKPCKASCMIYLAKDAPKPRETKEDKIAKVKAILK